MLIFALVILIFSVRFLLQRLARWVTKQRKHYKAKQEGKYNTLDDEKEQRLHDIGFVFNTKTKAIMRATVMKRFEERWEINCEKLVAFKNEFGHCAVPRRWKRDLQFASWVMRQVRNSFLSHVALKLELTSFRIDL